VRGPNRAIVRGTQAAPRDQRFAMRQPFGFDEKLVESRVRAIGPVRRERELQITGQFQPTQFA
jgi:hypothetical protein